MKYMLDTDICIYLSKERPRHVLNKFKTLREEDVIISSVAFSELNYGAEKSQFTEKNLLALNKFVIFVKVVSYDHLAGSYYGKIRVDLEKRGIPIGAMDLMIAAHAISLNATLVTNNMKEFSRVKDLKLENWV